MPLLIPLIPLVYGVREKINERDHVEMAFWGFNVSQKDKLFKLVHDSHDRDKSHGKLTLKPSQPESRRKSQNILRIGSMTFKYTEVMSLNKKTLNLAC